MSLSVKHLYRFGPFDLDAEQRLVRRDGAKIPLPPKAFDVLLYMIRNPLRLVTKEELLRAVWPDSFVEEGNLSQNIFLLRKALANQEDDSRYIVTIPGRGYQFALAVEKVSELPQSEAGLTNNGGIELSSVRSTMHILVHEEIDDRTSSTPTEEAEYARAALTGASRRPRGRRLAVAGLLLVGLATGSFFWWRGHRKPPSSQTIVLADFDNRTGDGTFDVVLKKALEIDLTQSPYLDVMSEHEAVGMLQLMGRRVDAALTPDVAREVCQRSNRQVMLVGSIANLGREYLLTLEATDCISGKKLADAKVEAASKEKVLAALDLTADKLRHGLGESVKSVEQFQVPIAQATTSSLEALKAYSIGEYMVGRTGKEETETLPVFQRAVELDPNFAMAYAAIATDYYNLNEYKLAAPYYQKAFDLSGQVSEKERLYIRAHYYADSRKDVEQGIKEFQLWAATYPRDWGPWLNIANEYTQLGQYTPAIAAGEQAVRLDPSRGINYNVLARAYMRVNRFADARSTALHAVAIGKDSYGLHATLFEIAFVEHDQAAMSHEIAWSQGRPSAWFSLYVQAFAAATVGKYKQAEQLFHHAYSIAERENLDETADDILIDQATMEFEMGMSGAARDTLRHVKQQDEDNPDLAFLKAELGDISFAEHFLATNSSASHPGTLIAYVYLPRLRAEIALQRGKPLDAITALDSTESYELASGFTVFAQRGEAYRRVGQVEKAAIEYEKILAHQGVDPISPLFPLAHLWLGRGDAQAGRVQESRSEYEEFFALWKDADKDLPILLVARREYAALTAAHR
jgi:DNA-binding winged helix-turn-helix (wHTH) protein/predicted Zn-dependent protease